MCKQVVQGIYIQDINSQLWEKNLRIDRINISQFRLHNAIVFMSLYLIILRIFFIIVSLYIMQYWLHNSQLWVYIMQFLEKNATIKRYKLAIVIKSELWDKKSQFPFSKIVFSGGNKWRVKLLTVALRSVSSTVSVKLWDSNQAHKGQFDGRKNFRDKLLLSKVLRK